MIPLNDDEAVTWSLNSEYVHKALAYIKKRRHIKPEELVAWDLKNGKRLFQWKDTEAAQEWRIQQARVFLNSFRYVFDRIRVRKFMNVPESETGIAGGAYLDSQAISEDPKLRDWAIQDLTKKSVRLTEQLAFWNLSLKERRSYLGKMNAVFESRAS